LVHVGRGFRVLERLALHHVAPVAGGVADRQQDRPILRTRPGERLLAPGIPVDRVVLVLEEVRARLLGQAIGHRFETTPGVYRYARRWLEIYPWARPSADTVAMATTRARARRRRMPMATTAVDFDAIKQKQRAVWGSGDYAQVATLIVPMAEALCGRAGLRAGWRTLDVACGTGNAAIAAARRGCRVTGVDYVPALLERARE